MKTIYFPVYWGRRIFLIYLKHMDIREGLLLGMWRLELGINMPKLG